MSLENSIDINECDKETKIEQITEEIKFDIKGKHQQIPSRHDILKSSLVGKSSRDHSFTSEACFEHTVIFLLKTGYLNGIDQRSFLQSHPLILHLEKMLQWSKNIQFIDLKNQSKKYTY